MLVPMTLDPMTTSLGLEQAKCCQIHQVCGDILALIMSTHGGGPQDCVLVGSTTGELYN